MSIKWKRLAEIEQKMLKQAEKDFKGYMIAIQVLTGLREGFDIIGVESLAARVNTLATDLVIRRVKKEFPWQENT